MESRAAIAGHVVRELKDSTLGHNCDKPHSQPCRDHAVFAAENAGLAYHGEQDREAAQHGKHRQAAARGRGSGICCMHRG